MDANDLLKYAPEAAKAMATAAGVIKFTDLLNKVLTPPASELGEALRDNVRLYRYPRMLKMLKKAEQMAQKAGFTPKAVPVKTLLPLLEGASLEHDESLHTMWAALLANASNPQNDAKPVHIAFSAILNELTPLDALLLDYLRWHVRSGAQKHPGSQAHDFIGATLGRVEAILKNAVEQFSKTDPPVQTSIKDLYSALDNLVRVRLVSSHLLTSSQSVETAANMTNLGLQFFDACQPPDKRWPNAPHWWKDQ